MELTEGKYRIVRKRVIPFRVLLHNNARASETAVPKGTTPATKYRVFLSTLRKFGSLRINSPKLSNPINTGELNKSQRCRLIHRENPTAKTVNSKKPIKLGKRKAHASMASFRFDTFITPSWFEPRERTKSTQRHIDNQISIFFLGSRLDPAVVSGIKYLPDNCFIPTM